MQEAVWKDCVVEQSDLIRMAVGDPAAIFAVIADERYMISDVMRTQNGPRQLHKALKCAGIDCAERNHVRAARHILN